MKSQFLAAAFAAVALAAPAKDVVITIYPAYDWTRTVVGTHANEFNLDLYPGISPSSRTRSTDLGER